MGSSDTQNKTRPHVELLVGGDRHQANQSTECKTAKTPSNRLELPWGLVVRGVLTETTQVEAWERGGNTPGCFWWGSSPGWTYLQGKGLKTERKLMCSRNTTEEGRRNRVKEEKSRRRPGQGQARQRTSRASTILASTPRGSRPRASRQSNNKAAFCLDSITGCFGKP